MRIKAKMLLGWVGFGVGMALMVTLGGMWFWTALPTGWPEPERRPVGPVARPSYAPPMAILPWKRAASQPVAAYVSPAQTPWRRQARRPVGAYVVLAQTPWRTGWAKTTVAEAGVPWARKTVGPATVTAGSLPWERTAAEKVNVADAVVPWRRETGAAQVMVPAATLPAGWGK